MDKYQTDDCYRIKFASLLVVTTRLQVSVSKMFYPKSVFGLGKSDQFGWESGSDVDLEPVRQVVERLGGSTEDFDRIEPELESLLQGYKSGLITKREMKKKRKELLGSIRYQ